MHAGQVRSLNTYLDAVNKVALEAREMGARVLGYPDISNI